MENLVMTSGFWYRKKVFVTGHTGFKGGWLCLWLQSLGAEVTGYSLAPGTNPSLFWVAKVGQEMHSIIGDIRNDIALNAAMRLANPEIVIHLAAQPLVRRSYANPVETYSTNVMGTVHLFEAIRNTSSVRSVVNVTSDKCYENKEWLWGYREDEPMGGYDPYSNSKGCSELITSAYRSSYFNPDSFDTHRLALASARAGNVIGGGDWSEDRLIPDILKAIRENRPVVIRNPNAIRPWQHVLEPVSGYLKLAQKLYENGPEFSGAWNFGPADSDAKPVKSIVESLTHLWGPEAQWRLDDAIHPHEALHLKLDCSKARTKLGWSAKWPLEQALSQIVQWQKAYLEELDMRDFTLMQLSTFLKENVV